MTPHMDKIKLRGMHAQMEGALDKAPWRRPHPWGLEGRVCLLTDATRFHAEQKAQGEKVQDTLGRK